MAPPLPFARKNKANVVLTYDFTTEFKASHFSAWLGNDGKLIQDGGLVLSSPVFKSTRTVGDKGFLDHYKMALYYNTPIEFSRRHEVLLRGVLSNKQVFPKGDSPFPAEYLKRVFNAYEDPRLAHGQFTFIDPKTGIVAGFVLTDQLIYTVYGRNDALSGCDIKCGASNDCDTCLSDAFTCDNFMTDPNYQLFKQNMTDENFSRFVLFVRWANWCQQNKADVFDWDLFRKFQEQYPDVCAKKLSSDVFSAWLSSNNYREYCLSGNWPRWLAGYRDLYSCGLPAVSRATCSDNSCSAAIFGPKAGCSVCNASLGGACVHKYIGGVNCYESKPESKCCCVKLASFLDLHPVQRREACDPLCDPIEVYIGIDRAASVINFYIGSKRVHQIIGIGRRSASLDRVIDFDGDGKTLDVASGLVCFGTGTIVDAALPGNFSTWRVTENNVAVSALTNTLPTSAYRQIYPNKMGERLAVVPEQTFADPNGNVRSRIWGQGDVLKVQSFSVLHRRPVRDLEVMAEYAKSECCGFINCNSVNASGCLPNDCDPENDSLIEYLDPRDLEVLFSTPAKPIVGDDEGVQPRGGGGVGSSCSGSGKRSAGETCIRAKIAKTDQRPFGKYCGDEFYGVDPSQ